MEPFFLNELVSNNNLDNLFEDIFSIEEVKVYKPDSKVYDIPVKNMASNLQKLLF